MPLGIWSAEWLNLNGQRRYPLTDDSSGRDATGAFQLPTDVLLEVDLPIHYGLDVSAARFFLMQLSVYQVGFQFVFGYQPDGDEDPVAVATALVPRATHTPGTAYTLGGIGDYVDTLGKVVVGRFDNLDAQPAGQFAFTLDDARLEPDCVRPIVRGLSSIAVRSGGQVSQRMYGDIELVAQDNIQLVPVIVAGQNPEIRISAIQGEGLAETCVCVGESSGPPVKRINGLPPTPDGNFTLLGDTCLKVEPIGNGLKLRDECSAPCCGCRELEEVTQALETIGTRQTTIEAFVSRLQASVTQFEGVVLGSRLNDKGCTTCT